MWPKKTTAFLIIHGMGEQNPYETLDSFIRPFWDLLKKEPSQDISGFHKYKKRPDWAENYMSLQNKQNENPIDFFEYYWANVPQRTVSLQEIFDWLITTSEGARKFYEENIELVEKYEGLGSKAFSNKKFKKYWYLKHASKIFRLICFLKIPKIKYIEPLIRLLLNKAERVIIDYVGDVVVYSSTDIKSNTYEIRKKILDGAAQKLRLLLEDEKYEQIIVVGHSLGSVIAYDTLNRINLEMNIDPQLGNKAGKLKGLVTFGSPLDKIAFFFREHTTDEEFIRRQILANFHSFKNRELNLKKDPVILGSPYLRLLDEKVYWINFWDVNDPVSGNLDFYEVNENIKLNLQKPFGIAHTKYWEFTEMYEMIARQFIN